MSRIDPKEYNPFVDRTVDAINVARYEAAKSLSRYLVALNF